MPEPTPIRVPLDNVNDETVKLLAWLVQEGQLVREGQLLAEVETSKAVVEMLAPLSGKVWLRAQPGAEVPVGAIIAYMTVNGARPTGSSPHPSPICQPQVASQTGSGNEKPGQLPPGTTFSKRALQLLEEREINPQVFAGRGMVREQDVRQYLKEAASYDGFDPAGVHFALHGLDLRNVTLPKDLSKTQVGVVDPSFLNELQADPAKFGKLSSAEKCELYRKSGAIVGSGAVLAAGTLVIAPQIVIGEEVQLGENTSIQCRERFCVGRFTSFRRNLTIRGGTIVLGENIFAGQNIQIGGGGNADPWSLLCVGDDTYLGDDVFINICRPVLIGKEVFLTQRSILVTHNIGHSPLDGYENRFAPIVLEDYAQIGMNSTIYAGSSIGTGAIVASNSYVISSVPAGKFAIGVPAKVVHDAARPVDPSKQLQIAQAMVRDYHELLTRKGYEVSPLETSPYRFTVEHVGKRLQLMLLETLSNSDFRPESADETVFWTLDSASMTPPLNCTVMYLLLKEVKGPAGIFSDSTREFLRKRGIRCKPGPWRYRRGLI
jgi:acetyltransferase-like isoleucine patch superfamily enzyme